MGGRATSGLRAFSLDKALLAPSSDDGVEMATTNSVRSPSDSLIADCSALFGM